MIPAVEPGNAAVWSVSELSGALKRTLEDAFGHVRLRGEISGYRGPHASGHAYFCLKDRDARLDAVVWKTSFARMRFKPQEGLEVIATGRITTFPGKSTYQIVVEQLEPAGVGALMALLEERRRKLAAEGLFATERKRPLPFLPRVVGVVTSPTGAVIRDILHRLEDRFPRRVLLWPVRVQGESCADEVAAAIAGLNALPADGPMPRPDVIIVARGGGSLEDLWGFNEEAVVRAAAQSGVPVISAVGHETDWTLLDHVADLRAPTPTGAAEMAVPVRLELLSRLNSLAGRQAEGARRGAETRRRDLRSAVRALPGAEAILAGPRQRLDRAAGKLPAALLANARIHERQLQAASGRLGRQSPQVRLAAVGARLTQAERRLPLEFRRGFEERRKDLLAITTRLQRARDASLRAEALRLAACRERVGVLSGRAARAVATLLQRDRRQLAAFGGLLGSLSYRSVLARGYALVRGSDDRPIARAAAIAPGQIVTIEFADGRRKAQAEGGKAKRRAEPLVQTELFDN